MPRRPDRDIIAELLDRYDELLKTAFLRAVDDIRSNIVLRVVVERLEKGDVGGAIEAMHLDADAFARLELAIADTYNSGGQATVGNLPRVTDPSGNRVVYRFGVRNPEAEVWLRSHSGNLVTGIVEDQRQGIRAALEEGLSQGRNPRSTALDVIGRVSRATNRREGGVIGLTTAQGEYVARARQELLSGEPDQLRNYLTRGRRDKRFDRTVAKAIRDGKAIPAETVNRMVGRYSDRLLELRGDLLAQNETMTALARSRTDAIRQQIASGKIDAAAVTKVWKHTPQEHPRLHHQAMNGKSVPFGEKFVLPNGVMMDHPHSDDAPISETAFCKCYFTFKIDYFASVVRRYKAEAA